MDENAPTTRMISEEPDRPGRVVEIPPPSDPGQPLVVETRRRLISYACQAATAHAGVFGPDDDPTIVVEHRTGDVRRYFSITADQARGLREDLAVALEEYDRITAEQA